MVNLSAFIRFHAEQRPDHPAILYGDRSVTYAELWARCRRLAAYLHRRQIGPDDVVAVYMKNSAAFIEVAVAVSYIGAVFLPVNFRLARDEVNYIIGNAGAKLLIADGEFASIATGLGEHLLLDETLQADTSGLAASAPEPRPAPRGPDDLYRLMYTSGTTDHPKGVMISYGNFYWKSMDHVMALGLGAADRLLTVGPLYHVGGLDLPGLAVLWVGGTMCIQRDFDPAAVLAAIAEHRLTGGWMAPTMTNGILGLDDAGRYDLGSFRWLIGGGERTPEQRIREFGEVFPGARYIDAYGMTETVSGDTLMEAGRELDKIGSTGRALAHVEIAIFDDAGTPLPPGTEGEIVMRGPKVTRGYWRDPEKTAETIQDGWLRSGDVGHLDDEGFLFLTDRKKDLIVSGGENIASSEVERVIYDLPEVSEAAVIGIPDPEWGERPVAVIVTRPGATLDYDSLAAHCRRHLAGFKVPSALHLRSELPRNPSGKVLKRTLRAQLR